MFYLSDILAPLDGRIGPLEVVFDQKSIVGTMGLRLESDQLAVSSAVWRHCLNELLDYNIP